jgi:hypothetical protein
VAAAVVGASVAAAVVGATVAGTAVSGTVVGAAVAAGLQAASTRPQTMIKLVTRNNRDCFFFMVRLLLIDN